MQFKTVGEIIDFAILKEQSAADLYASLAENAQFPHMKKIFEGFSREELEHKRKLAELTVSDIEVIKPQKISDLKLSDYTETINPENADTYQKALILAMHEEKASFKMYTYLAEHATDEKIKNLFYSLAAEEAKHKLRFEVEYDEYILTEN